ncbi:MAG TPA: DUF2505 domain-containing protein [Polyangiales bacterium]
MPTPRRITYEYASDPDTVAKLLVDADFLRRRSEAAGDTNVEVKVEELGDGMHITVARNREIDLPAFAKKIISPQNRIVEDTTWRRENGQWVAEYFVQVAGVPGEVRGKSTLKASAQGTIYESNFQVTSRIPIVGGKLEAVVADKLEETFRINAERNAKQLEG